MRPGRKSRSELGLVVMAGVLTAGAYTLASLGKNAEIPGHHRTVHHRTSNW